MCKEGVPVAVSCEAGEYGQGTECGGMGAWHISPYSF